jgi:hypothetical protein
MGLANGIGIKFPPNMDDCLDSNFQIARTQLETAAVEPDNALFVNHVLSEPECSSTLMYWTNSANYMKAKAFEKPLSLNLSTEHGLRPSSYNTTFEAATRILSDMPEYEYARLPEAGLTVLAKILLELVRDDPQRNLQPHTGDTTLPP